MSWEGGKGGTVVRWKGEKYQVLFKGAGRRVIPRFYIFVSGVNQKSDFLVWSQG